MRDFSHWSPYYIYYRLQDMLYRKLNPDNPWLTPDAVNFLHKILNTDCSGVEYGSGRSTTWFASRVKNLVSIEHNAIWFNKVSQIISEKKLANIEYHHFPAPENNLSLHALMSTSYVHGSDSLQINSLDFALIDGIQRPACALRAIPVLKTGGWLILDDANHYLPSTSSAPNSRSLNVGPLNPDWEEVEQVVRNWNALWFGNGIKETLFLQKP